MKTSKFLLLILILAIIRTVSGQQATTLTFRNNTYDIYHVDLTSDSIQFFLSDSDFVKLRSLGRLKGFVEQSGHQLLFATNGGMYKKDGSPQGLYIENYKTIIPIDTGSGYGNFYMKPNGIFIVGNHTAGVIKTEDFTGHWEEARYATQSGPLLVIDGQIHPAFNSNSTSKYIRSGIGIIDKQNIVFAISNQPVNFYEFALLFRDAFKCQNALYLDGAISKMYIKESDRNELEGQFGCMIGHISN